MKSLIISYLLGGSVVFQSCENSPTPPRLFDDYRAERCKHITNAPRRITTLVLHYEDTVCELRIISEIVSERE